MSDVQIELRSTLTCPHCAYIGLINHGSMPSSLANFLATSS